MRNPWLQKNPFLSMWLSAANSMLSFYRGQASAMTKAATKQASDEMVRAMTGTAAPRKGKRKATTATRPRKAATPARQTRAAASTGQRKASTSTRRRKTG